MGTEISFDQALAAVADGLSIDWDAMERVARDADDQRRVRSLKLLAAIAEHHRSTVDPLEQAAAEAATQLPSPRPTPPANRPASGVRKAAADAVARKPPRAEVRDAHNSMNVTHDDHSGPKNAPLWGRYRLVEKVGSGGFGQVYRAWEEDLDREVAIKLLHEHVSDEQAGQRVRQEGKALARIRQANVVTVHGVEVHEGRAGLVMEFVRGQTLDEVVRARGPYSAPEAVLIGVDVCRALSAVHRARYIHRDVKARNVIREQAGRIVLMDFGTGREEQPGTPAGSDLTGTPLYMAPEVLDRRPASPRSDVYSVGVLLFFLVSGFHPVQARTTNELRAAHRDGRRRYLSELRSDIPSAFVRVVERALAPKPEERYSDAAALLEALSRTLIDEPPVEPRRVKWMRRVAIGAPALAALFVALGALTSAAFNNTLDRVGFADESVLDRTLYGVQSVLAPLVVLLLGWFAFGALQAVRGLITGLSPRIRAFDDRVRNRLAFLGRYPQHLAAAVLLISGAGLVTVWWIYWPLLDATTGSASTRSATVLTVLSPVHEAYQDGYFQAISVLFVATAAALFLLLRLAARQRVAISAALLIGFAGVLCLELGSRTLSYRILIRNKGFDPVQMRDQPCFAMGERQDQVLVFCAGSSPPRSMLVPKAEIRPDPTRRGQSVFTGLGTSR